MRTPSGGVLYDQNGLLHRYRPWTELLPASGRYRVRITAGEGGSGAYEVAVRSTGVTPRPLEMNAPAAGIDEGGVDFWSFEGTGGQVVTVTVNPSDAPMGFDIMSPVGDLVAWTHHSQSARAVAHLPVDGRYVVRVRGLSATPSGAYEVAVRSAVDVATAPRPLEMDAPATGTVEHDGSGVGLWAFEGAAGRTVSITVVANGFNPLIQLMLPTGEELASARDDNWDGSVGLEALLPGPGRYVVRAMVVYGRWSHRWSGEYQVAVRPVIR